MGYWFGNTHDRADSWHWIGVATSLSQSLGFHRDPGQSGVSLYQRRLWRRVWWYCFYRDRWIAWGMGRPMRIALEDCDVPELTKNDLYSQPHVSGLSSRAIETVERCNGASPMFLDMLSLMRNLGRIFATQYRPQQSPPSLSELQKEESDLHTWMVNIDPCCWIDGTPAGQPHESSKAEIVHRSFVHISYQ